MKNLKNRVLTTAVTGALVVVTGVQSAFALSTEAATAMTAVQTDGLALVDLAWPVVGAITVAFIGLKLFKRAAGKV